jgi:hypothetical protein
MRGRKPSITSVIAVLALFVALAGSAVAASRYLITSTSQISPGVLRQLRGTPAASASAAPKKVKVTNYAEHLVLGQARRGSAKTLILELPGLAAIQESECRDLSVGEVVVEDRVPGDTSELNESDGAGEEHLASGWTTYDVNANARREHSFVIATGSGSTALFADVTVNIEPIGSSECAFTATAQVYKG